MNFSNRVEILRDEIEAHIKASRSSYYKVRVKHHRIVEDLYKQLIEVVDELLDYAKECGWEVRKSNNEFYQEYLGGVEKLLEYTVSKKTRSMTVYADKAGFVCIGVTHSYIYDCEDENLLTGLDNVNAIKYLEVY